MYLYEDAAEQHRRDIFAGCDHTRYSSVSEEFEEKGEKIFGKDIAAVSEKEQVYL